MSGSGTENQILGSHENQLWSWKSRNHRKTHQFQEELSILLVLCCYQSLDFTISCNSHINWTSFNKENLLDVVISLQNVPIVPELKDEQYWNFDNKHRMQQCTLGRWRQINQEVKYIPSGPPEEYSFVTLANTCEVYSCFFLLFLAVLKFCQPWMKLSYLSWSYVSPEWCILVVGQRIPQHLHSKI